MLTISNGTNPWPKGHLWIPEEGGWYCMWCNKHITDAQLANATEEEIGSCNGGGA